jgi:hypothetical protein
MTEETSA